MFHKQHIRDENERARNKESSSEAVAKESFGRYKTLFYEAQGKEMVDHLLYLEERPFGVTLSDLRSVALELIEKNIACVFNTGKRMVIWVFKMPSKISSM